MSQIDLPNPIKSRERIGTILVCASFVMLLIVVAIDWRWGVPVFFIQFIAMLAGWCGAEDEAERSKRGGS